MLSFWECYYYYYYYYKLKLLLLSYGFILWPIILLLWNLEALPEELPQISFSSSSQISSLIGSGITGGNSFSGTFLGCLEWVLAGFGGD